MKSYNKRKRTRFVVLFYLTALLFAALIFRLVRLQYYNADKFQVIAKNQHEGWIQVNALRGAIYDRNGTNLAFSLAMPSVAVNPRKVVNPDRTAFYLALALGKKKNEILSLLNRRMTFAWVARKIERDKASRIRRLKLPGVFVIEEPTGRRFYPKKRVASHILGYTGIDDQGLEGVEASYDDILKGKPGYLTAEMDQKGRMLPGGDVKFKPPTPGRDIYLTIDETIQYIVERELQETVKKFNAAGGTIIVYNPKNGDVLALASYPDFNPSNPATIKQKLMRNRAVTDSYEPGSTFKVILAAAALDSGLVSPRDQFYCGKSIHVGGYSLRNADDGLYSPTGRETISGIITYSFNVGAASLGMRVGKKVYYKYIDRFGFGKQTGIDLPGETEGIVTPGKHWKPINLATISYGQGIAVTPMQMVQSFGAIANDGVMMKPRIVRKIVDANGKVVGVNKPKALVRVIKPKTCHEILKVLANVCEKGTAKKARIPGYKCGGKTGTANMVVNGVYANGRYIASFIGVVPVDDPQIVMLVKIDEPKGVIWGGSVAAPSFKRIGSQIMWKLGVKPNNTAMITEDFKKSNSSEDGN